MTFSRRFLATSSIAICGVLAAGTLAANAQTVTLDKGVTVSGGWPEGNEEHLVVVPVDDVIERGPALGETQWIERARSRAACRIDGCSTKPFPIVPRS